MIERLKPSLRGRLGRAAVPMVAVGLIGLGGTLADTTISWNAIDSKANRTFPPAASFEEFTRAREAIAIYDQKSHELIREGEFVIDTSKITDSSKLQQAITLVREEQERQKQAALLSHKLSMKLLKRNIVTGAASAVLAFTGISLWRNPQENRRKPTKTFQQTNLNPS